MADAVLSFRVHMWALRPVEFARGLLRVYAASPFEGRCRVSSWWQIQGDRPGVDVGSPLLDLHRDFNMELRCYLLL